MKQNKSFSFSEIFKPFYNILTFLVTIGIRIFVPVVSDGGKFSVLQRSAIHVKNNFTIAYINNNELIRRNYIINNLVASTQVSVPTALILSNSRTNNFVKLVF